jgi:hypothetical protein
MGISAARVCQYERSAILRLQQYLNPFRPGNGHEVVVVARRMRHSRASEVASGPAQGGWFRVTKLSGNGVFPPAAVCFAFNELRSIHEENYRPPIVVGSQVGYISAAAMDEGNLTIEVRLTGSGQTLSQNARRSAELEVEIMHDVPVIAAGVVAN